MSQINIRHESNADQARITEVVTSAFKAAVHSSGKEADVIDQLRINNALSISLVATIQGDLVGHIAFS